MQVISLLLSNVTDFYLDARLTIAGISFDALALETLIEIVKQALSVGVAICWAVASVYFGTGGSFIFKLVSFIRLGVAKMKIAKYHAVCIVFHRHRILGCTCKLTAVYHRRRCKWRLMSKFPDCGHMNPGPGDCRWRRSERLDRTYFRHTGIHHQYIQHYIGKCIHSLIVML